MSVAVKNNVEICADRRAFGRRETHMPASVRLPNHTLYDCFIRDISEGGALLEFPQRVEISGRLRLSFDNGNQDIICDVRHTRGNRAGVQFVRNITLAARPVAEPAAGEAPSLTRRGDTAAGNGRSSAASELVALRRNAAKMLPPPGPSAASDIAPAITATSIAGQEPWPQPPRDISSLLQSVAALAAARAVPRPLPARAFAKVIAPCPVMVVEDIVPRDMSSLLKAVAILAACRAPPRPLPACAYDPIAA